MGQKLPEASDRRVLRTRRALREAMIALINERGWERFNVQDVCDRADVGRSTFYVHYADKEDLLAGGFADLREGLRAAAAADGTGEPLGFVRGLLAHAFEQRRLFLAVVGKRSGHVVQRGFRELVLDLVRDDLASAPAGPRRDGAAAFLGGAVVEFLTWCLEAKVPPALDDAEALFRELARPVVAAATTARAPGRGR